MRKHRQKVAKQLDSETIVDYQSKRYADMSGTAVKWGNSSGPQTKTFLRKVRSEYSNFNLVTDVAQETKLLQELYYEQDNGGFSQNFSFRPFKVHLISVRQLHLFTKSKAKGLYFDATSSLIKPIPSQNIFIYILW